MNLESSPAVSEFVVIAEVWDRCTRDWMPGQRVPRLRLVKDTVHEVYREGISAADWKSAAVSVLCGPEARA